MLARLKKQDAEVEAAERATPEGVRAASGAVDENGAPSARSRVRERRGGGRANGVEGGFGMGEEMGEKYGGEGERDVVKGLMPGGFEGEGGLGEHGE